MALHINSQRRVRVYALAAVILGGVFTAPLSAEWIWVEGEKPTQASMNRHDWYDQVKRDQLSGGDFISNYSPDKPGEATYTFQATVAGDYDFWVRANPVQARLKYRLNGREWTEIDFR